VYLESGRSLFGTTTEKVRDFYREHGFDIADPRAVPDEISLELEFLGLLAGQRKQEDESWFLSRLFRPWFVQFRDIVIMEARLPFYVALVKMIDFFTLQEED
jgi:TorA maturation chaperone TorD